MIEKGSDPMDVTITERAKRVQDMVVNHYGILLPFNLALAVQVEINGAVEEARQALLTRPGGRVKTPEELQAMHGDDDVARREQIIADAIAEDRFVLFIERYDVAPGAIAFCPRYDEAPLFLGVYVVPFVTGSQATFRHTSWRAAQSWTEFIRFSQVRTVKLYTETPDQLRGLEAQLDEMIEAARLKAEDERRNWSDYLRKANRQMDAEHGGS